MQDINNCIKENDTDNVTLNKLKELGTKLTGQDNVQGETVAEVLDFINNNYSGGGSGGSSGSSDITLNLKVNGMSKEPFVYGNFKDNLYNSYNSISITEMKFNIDNISTSSIVNGEIEIGTIYAKSYYDYAEIKLDGVICGVCTINGVKQMCMLRFETPTSGNTKVYLLLNNTSVLTSTAQTLSIEATGTLHHNYTPGSTE